MLKRLSAIVLSVILVMTSGVSIAAEPKRDENGRITEMETASGDKIYFAYDEEGNVSGISVVATNAVEIGTAEELTAIRENMAGSYKLINDIDLIGEVWTPIGTLGNPFTGTLDGNGFAIQNLNINKPNQDYVGLIGNNAGTILNLGLENASVTGRNITGGIAGYNANHVIGCYAVSSVVKGADDTGGLVGNNIGAILKSYYEGEVFGEDFVGGVVGNVSDGSVERCYVAANVIVTGSSAGGLAGVIDNTNSAIRNSFSAGKVEGGSVTAGFIGTINFGKVENCYAVSGNPNGFSGAGDFTNCYVDGDWLDDVSTVPEARTTEQMMKASTYKDWDFTTIWEIEEGAGYPTLQELPKPETGGNLPGDLDGLLIENLLGGNASADEVTTDLQLPTVSANGARIFWESSNPEIISSAGVVIRPPYGSGTAEITLTARFVNAFASEAKTFQIKVPEAAPVNAEVPVIAQWTQDSEASLNEPFEISVVASVKSGTLRYQWYEVTDDGDILIPDATSAAYSVPTGELGEKRYYCVITNHDDAATGKKSAEITSETITVTTRSNAERPRILQQPEPVTVLDGEKAVLTVSAEVSEGTLSYQWYEQVGEDIVQVEAETEYVFSAPTVVPSIRYYFCEVTNTDERATGSTQVVTASDVVMVKVNSREDAEIPTITGPADVSVLEREAATLTLTATVETGTLTYQWYEVTSDGDILLPDATQASYAAPTDAVGVRTYYCEVTNTDETATGNPKSAASSRSATVTVVAIVDAEAPVIAEVSPDFIVSAGGSATLFINADVSGGTLSYQWYEQTAEGDSPVGGNQAYFVANTDTLGERVYYCVVTNTDTSVTGNQQESVTGTPIRVTVSAQSAFHRVALDVNGIHRFHDIQEGYETPQARTVTISNAGLEGATGLATALTGGDTDAFTITQPDTTALSGEDTATFTVEANPALPPNTYLAIVSVTGDDNIMASAVVSLTVTDENALIPEPTPTPTPTPTPKPSNPPSNPGSSSGGGSSGGTPAAQTPATRTVSVSVNDAPMSAEVAADGTLILSITKPYEHTGETLTIDAGAAYTSISLNLRLSALGGDDLVVHTGFGVLRIPNEALSALGEVYGDTLSLSLKKGSFGFSLVDGNDKEVPFRDLDTAIQISLPYTLVEGQQPESVVAVRQNGTVIAQSVYENGAVNLRITESGVFNAAYRKRPLSDTAAHWAAASIDFVTARNLFTVFGGNRFLPNGAMTRAMFVQALAALDGADLSGYTASRFSDVSSDMPAVEWAAEAGITLGTGDGKFSPDAAIDRQQMAVMLVNYLKYRGLLPQSPPAPAFADEGEISGWALESVRAIQNLGIITGRPGNLYDPRTTATRAEAAVIFNRLIELNAH